MTESITITRPITDVFPVLTEPRFAKLWLSLVLDAELTTPEPISSGSTAWYTVKLFGRHLRVEGEWLVYDAPYTSVFKAAVSPFQLQVTFHCTPVNTGTQAEIRAEFGNNVFFGVTSGTVRTSMSKSFAHDLTLLKTYMETTPWLFDQLPN